MTPQALAAVATLISYAANGNRVDLTLDRGHAELVWISPASFHFRRSLEGALPATAPEAGSDAVAFEVEDTPAALRLRSRRIQVEIRKQGATIAVRRSDGTSVISDLSQPKAEGELVTWEREAPNDARFYGLGAISDPQLDLRGKVINSALPFLFSSAGYGEFHPGAGAFRFDFTNTGSYRIQAPQVDYYFYFGPTPKAIFEEHKNAPGSRDLAPRSRPASWINLREDLLALVHDAMSSPTLGDYYLSNYAGTDQELLRRARQFASLLPDLHAGVVPLSPFRSQLNSFFDIYAIETRDKGYPIWHGLPFEFPEDAECGRHADEFMLGDEMLIAPIYESGNTRTVYLPSGKWTSLETNQEYSGRQTITVETSALPVFAHNGAIVPLDSEGGIALHYFPNAGGEFFLLEKDIGAYSQVHAAPAGDILRLEIEAKKDRDYQWVVHHVERPAEVGLDQEKFRNVASLNELADRTWFYDATAKNLIVRLHVNAGEDSIFNLSW